MRTLEPGDAAQHLSIDARESVYEYGCDGGPPNCGVEQTVIVTPSWAMRIGMADGVEVRVAAGFDTSLGVDAKLQLVRTRYFDAAVAPMAGVTLATRFEFGVERDGPVLTAALPLSTLT